MSLQDEMHDLHSRQASAAAGNSFEHSSNRIPGLDIGQLAQQRRDQPAMPIPGRAPQVAPLTDAALAQKAAMEHRRGQYEERLASIPERLDAQRELAELRAELRARDTIDRYRSEHTPQSATLAGALAPMLGDAIERRGSTILCEVMPVAGAVGCAVALWGATTGSSRVAAACVGLVVGGYLGHRLSPCGGDGPGLLDLLAAPRPKSAQVDSGAPVQL
jgi:hypothetical protein